MESYLYLLEVYVNTITFSSMVEEKLKASDVIVTAEVGKSIKVDIFTMHQQIDAPTSNTLEINCGKSNLFARTPSELQEKLTMYPLDINVSIKRRSVGGSTMKWDKSFYDLIESSVQTYGVSGPVSMQDKCLLEDAEGKIIGDIKITVRLSSFGMNIQTGYQLISPDKDAKKKYLIRGARGDTTFECQKFGNGSSADMLPVSPLFTTQQTEPQSSYQPPYLEEEPLSWMALFKSTLDPKTSTLPDEFSIAISNMFSKTMNPLMSSTTFDIVSIAERPDEGKFIDLRIRGGSQGLIFELDPLSSSGAKKSVSAEESICETPFSSERVEQLLCKSKDCPAVKKFKEFGLGPLAKGKGLGSLRNDMTPPVTYGLSQTYGVFDEYGPYGLFKRPKRPENPFIPGNKNNDWSETCWKPKRNEQKRNSCCKEQIQDDCYKEQKQNDCGKEKKRTDCCKEHPPLRLTGGGLTDADNFKSPLHECQDIMNQFDEVLAKYRKALGPCGQVTCPFAPNITKETCKKVCCPDETISEAETKQYKLGGPTLGKGDTTNPFAACGSPKCAYAKYKKGLTDEDAMMELQYLPSPTSGMCGHPKCPYPVELDLPPIHWDCPDPLPKTPCKNPDCPYQPKQIKCLNAVMKKGPCDNPNCPYAVPEPCESPNCPFSSKDCPYHQQEAETNSLCENPECPYGNNSGKNNKSCPQPPSCPMPLCPNMPCPGMPCPMPFCSPFANPILQAVLMQYLQAVTCGNPDAMKLCFGEQNCPYMAASKQTPKSGKQKDTVCRKEQKEKSDPMTNCDNPTCPYKAPEPPGDLCENPDCPYADPGSANGGSDCFNPGQDNQSCPQPSPCPNTPCPMPYCLPYGNPILQAVLMQYLQAATCGSGDISKLCFGGPTCPYMAGESKQTAKTGKQKDMDNCDNPACPYKLPEDSNDLCENPDCPYAENNASECCYDEPSIDESGGCSCSQSPKQSKRDNEPCSQTVDDSDCGSPVCPPPSICGFPPMVPCGLNPIQAMLALNCLPFSICNDVNCPYTAKEINELLLSCFGGPSPGGKSEEKRTSVSKGGDLERKDILPEQINGAEEIVETTYETREAVDMEPCTAKTCMSQGGALECEMCPCTSLKGQGGNGQGGQGQGQGQELVKRGKGSKIVKSRGKRKKGKYVYSIGDKYPGVQIGHRECVMRAYNVPKTMGWLWNVFTPCLSLKPRKGWRPGAIGRLMAARIRAHREAQGLGMLHIKDLRSGKGYGEYESAASIHVNPKPTLQIKKKDGCYWITMNPLKDPHTLVENENPYMDCTPMQFKIVKNKEKKDDVDNEFKSCFCGDDEQPNAESSSSDSELDIEFTPPAGIIHPERFKKKRNVVHLGTQYLPADFAEAKSVKSDKKGKGKGKGKKEKKGKKK